MGGSFSRTVILKRLYPKNKVTIVSNMPLFSVLVTIVRFLNKFEKEHRIGEAINNSGRVTSSSFL